MPRRVPTIALAAVLTTLPASMAFATTPPSDPNDVAEIDNPVDENDSSGFDDWGLFGLLGLAGLAGLRKRNDRTTTVRDEQFSGR